jgi:hypothetical protein
MVSLLAYFSRKIKSKAIKHSRPRISIKYFPRTKESKGPSETNESKMILRAEYFVALSLSLSTTTIQIRY